MSSAWAAAQFFKEHGTKEGTCVCRLCNEEIILGTDGITKDGQIKYKASNLISHLRKEAHLDMWKNVESKLGDKSTDTVTDYIATICSLQVKDAQHGVKTQGTLDNMVSHGGVTKRVEVNYAFMAFMTGAQNGFSQVDDPLFKKFAAV